MRYAKYRYFFELHAPYCEVWARRAKSYEIPACLEVRTSLDENNDFVADNSGELLACGVDIGHGRLKVMCHGGDVVFDQEILSLGECVCDGSLRDLPCADDERIVFTVGTAECDGAGFELYTDELFDPRRIHLRYNVLDDGEGNGYSIMDLCDMDYDGLRLDFEDLWGGGDAEYRRFV